MRHSAKKLPKAPGGSPDHDEAGDEGNIIQPEERSEALDLSEEADSSWVATLRGTKAAAVREVFTGRAETDVSGSNRLQDSRELRSGLFSLDIFVHSVENYSTGAIPPRDRTKFFFRLVD